MSQLFIWLVYFSWLRVFHLSHRGLPYGERKPTRARVKPTTAWPVTDWQVCMRRESQSNLHLYCSQHSRTWLFCCAGTVTVWPCWWGVCVCLGGGGGWEELPYILVWRLIVFDFNLFLTPLPQVRWARMFRVQTARVPAMPSVSSSSQSGAPVFTGGIPEHPHPPPPTPRCKDPTAPSLGKQLCPCASRQAGQHLTWMTWCSSHRGMCGWVRDFP